MKMKKVIAVVLVTLLCMTSIAGPAMAVESKKGKDALSNDECYQEGYKSCSDIEAEGAVLLKNNNNCLPLKQGTKVTILGAMSFNYVQGGTGSGGGRDDVNTVMMNDAFKEAGLDVNQSAWTWLKNQCGGARNVNTADPAKVGWSSYTKIHEFPAKVYNNNKSSIIQDGYTDYAVVTFARSGAEGASPSMDYDGDGSTLTGTTYLQLNQDEKDLLTFCKENFKHTIVLINSASPMELGFIDSNSYNIDSCLWIGHPGEAGLVGIGTIISGRTNPSGRLVDTYAYDMSVDPTYYNNDNNKYTSGQPFYEYEEGIYMGYRFYETADSVGYFDSKDFTSHAYKNGNLKGYKQVVQFPFGYGLSYTSFKEKITKSNVQLKAHGTNTINVKVTNTGSVAGKDTVELYMDAPYQSDTENFGIKGKGLEKPKVVLAGFEKTDIVKPGSSAEVTITFNTDDLASYDNFGQGCYVLEKGKYSFNIQKNAHDWGASGSDNAVTDGLQANLKKSIIYNKSGDVKDAEYAGKRDSDAQIAKNALDDVTAGDGDMLDGYLSRSDMAKGMAAIMKHTSDEKPNEVLNKDVQTCLNLTGTNTYNYTFNTYIKGVKTPVSETIYAHGNDMMPFAKATPDGVNVSSVPKQKWGQTYYVLEDKKGAVKQNGKKLPTIVTDKHADGSAFHKLTCKDMKGVPINTPEGKAIWDDLVNEITLDEAIGIQGHCAWAVDPIPSIKKNAQKCYDGPGEPYAATVAGATWFPCAVIIAATWNRDVAYAEGVAYGHQDVLFGVNCAYAPAMNTHRSPFGGRNFEYYSEDGFIAGEIGGSAVAGIQSTGTGVFIKHFALNDNDTNRGGNTTWADEQAIREIYLRSYEIACKKYGANGIMGCMNRIGMSWKHYGMYVTILRKQWGWNGNLITDGDGADGDVYNTPQALLCSEGSLLASGIYINAKPTVKAFGDASKTIYGQYALHETMRHMLYQYCGGSVVSATTTTSTKKVNVFWIIVAVLGGIVVIGVAGGIVAIRKKKSAK